MKGFWSVPPFTSHTVWHWKPFTVSPLIHAKLSMLTQLSSGNPPCFFKNTWCFSWCSLSARLVPVDKSQWFPLVFLLLMWENHVLRMSYIWLECIGTITYTHYVMCFAHEWYQPINAHAHTSGLNIPRLLPLILEVFLLHVKKIKKKSPHTLIFCFVDTLYL